MTTTARLNALSFDPALRGAINEGLRDGIRRAFMSQLPIGEALANLATQANSAAARAVILAAADQFVTEEI